MDPEMTFGALVFGLKLAFSYLIAAINIPATLDKLNVDHTETTMALKWPKHREKLVVIFEFCKWQAAVNWYKSKVIWVQMIGAVLVIFGIGIGILGIFLQSGGLVQAANICKTYGFGYVLTVTIVFLGLVRLRLMHLGQVKKSIQ